MALGFPEEIDFLIVGDSKAGHFAESCLMPWADPYTGLVFSADSVTPTFHLDTLKKIRAMDPDFSPAQVFVFIGANNLNKNGLHAKRDFAFFNMVDLKTAWSLSIEQGESLAFLEAVLSRLFPVYGHRTLITHLNVGGRGSMRCNPSISVKEAYESQSQYKPIARNEIIDQNYYSIYERSMYADYISSPIELAAFDQLLAYIKSWGGKPVVVFPPVTPEIRQLEYKLIGEKFDDSIRPIIATHEVALLDLRDEIRFEFSDVNHLSRMGAYDLSREIFLEVIHAKSDLDN